MDKKELINGGKVKSVFTTDREDEVIIEFRDDMTAGDGARKEVMDKKGAYNATISAKIFKVLEENGIETQFIDLLEPNVMLAKKLEMIPIEVIVRNIATGSLVRKYPIDDGTKLDPPIVQMDFKDDEYHDPMLNRSLIKALEIASDEEIEILKKEFGLAMIINPELAAAYEIARVFQFPSAIRVDSFAKGHVELLHFRVGKDSPLINMKLLNLQSTFHSNVLVCTIIRGEDVIIPNGNFVFQENDIVAIVAKRNNAIDFFRKIGIMKSRVENAILAGGGKVSYYLAKILLQSGIDVTIIEVDRDRCEFLTEAIPEATIIHGDATDQDLLSQEGLEHTDGFAALTGLDEENILLSLYASEISNARTVTKINRTSFNSVINKLDLGSIIYPRVITADYILKYVRSTSNSIDSNVEKLYKLAGGKAEALEFLIKEDSHFAGIPLHDLNLRKNTLIGCIYRHGKVIIPSGQDKIMPGDSVLVVISGYRVNDIKEILEG